jgi:hypothetical protein
MKIGVILLAYNTSEYVDECLSSWVKLKSKYDITIGCVNGMFKEYIELGIEPEKNKSTLKKLINYDIDYLISTSENKLVDENFSRNFILNLVEKETDIVWILDCDEFYTEYDIENIVNYINQTPEFDWYAINFKNYTFTEKTFIDGFCPPRIFRTDRNGGINEFYFDNHILYNDGNIFETKPNKSIPRNIAWVEHYSWLNKDLTSQEKIKYQNQRFGGECAFKWNEDTKSLELIKEFYYNRNIEPPILHEVIDNLTKEFTIDFLRPDNKIFIKNIQSNLTADFKIYNGQSGNLIYETTMNLTSGIDYFIWTGSPKFLDIEGFKKFRVEVVVDNNIIHNEFIHI